MRPDSYSLELGLPPGAVAQHGLLVVAFFDAEGETRYGFLIDGTAPLSAVVGLLEVVKAHVFREGEDW